jgi:nitroimidazol reductase NimA-like FMN-containing flavoprotein (pyridoxamine 5'-phosphate oxidase superfamily)
VRRKDREITDRAEIESIIEKADICQIALSDNNQPYVFPVCFGHENNSIFFHSALEGKKIDIIQKNPRVCFQIHTDTELIAAEKGCDWSIRFRSVTGFGKAELIDELEAKKRAINIVLRHYSKKNHKISPESLEKTALIQIKIESMTGKKSSD